MNEIQESEIKCIKITYILHFVFYAIIIIFNIIIKFQILWIKNIIYYLFLASSLFGILFFLIPIIPLLFIYTKKLTKKNILTFRLLTFAFGVFSILLGLFFSIILMINTIETTDFCKECPFNIPLSDISNEETCKNKICLLNYKNLVEQYPYEDLCNYHATNDFDDNEGKYKRNIDDANEVESEYQIICDKYENNNYIIENELINKYINFCGNTDQYFICRRFFEPKSYNIRENFNCPEKKYIKKLYIFCFLNILVNLILSFIPWKSEMNIYDKIIDRLYPQTHRVSNSLNTTKNSSIFNKDAGEEKFKRVPTDLIIVCNNNNFIINNINNSNNNNLNNENINNENSNNNKININKKNNIKEEFNNVGVENENKRKNSKTEENEDNNINNSSNVPSSTEIFILGDKKKLKKNKNKNVKKEDK